MNKIILIGNLTRDPELRYTQQTQKPVCSFDIAVNRRQPDGSQAAQYFRVTTWNKTAEACSKYLAKGRKIFVSGPLDARLYQGNDGATRVSLEVTAEDVEFLSAREEGQGSYQAPAAPKPQAPQQTSMNSGFTAVETEDLPF